MGISHLCFSIHCCGYCFNVLFNIAALELPLCSKALSPTTQHAMASLRLCQSRIHSEANIVTTFRSRPSASTIRNRGKFPSPAQWRTFAATSARLQRRQEAFYKRLGAALRDTRVQWYTIPVGVGIGFLGGVQFYKVTTRERARHEEELRAQRGAEEERELGRPKKRPRVRPSGPWSVKVMSTLPLKALSRWWGWFNELDIPYYLRVPGFKLYSFIFGVK